MGENAYLMEFTELNKCLPQDDVKCSVMYPSLTAPPQVSTLSAGPWARHSRQISLPTRYWRPSERKTIVTHCGNVLRHFSQCIKEMKRGYSVWRGVGVCEEDTDPPTHTFPVAFNSLEPSSLKSENSQGDLCEGRGVQMQYLDSCSRYRYVHKMPIWGKRHWRHVHSGWGRWQLYFHGRSKEKVKSQGHKKVAFYLHGQEFQEAEITSEEEEGEWHVCRDFSRGEERHEEERKGWRKMHFGQLWVTRPDSNSEYKGAESRRDESERQIQWRTLPRSKGCGLRPVGWIPGLTLIRSGNRCNCCNLYEPQCPCLEMATISAILKVGLSRMARIEQPQISRDWWPGCL